MVRVFIVVFMCCNVRLTVPQNSYGGDGSVRPEVIMSTELIVAWVAIFIALVGVGRVAQPSAVFLLTPTQAWMIGLQYINAEGLV